LNSSSFANLEAKKEQQRKWFLFICFLQCQKTNERQKRLKNEHRTDALFLQNRGSYGDGDGDP
jgi:hypothetical protein